MDAPWLCNHAQVAGRKTLTSSRAGSSTFVWGDLAVLLAISRTGTLSGAARALSIERTTVGRRVAELEEALAVRLFDRTPQGYVATQAGEAALEHAHAIEEHAFAIERTLLGRDVRVAGTVRVTGLDPFVTDILLPHLDRLISRHPELVVIAATDTRVLDLSRREADIAIRYAAPRHPDHVGRRLGEFTSALYASTEYVARRGLPRTARALDGHDLIGLAPEFANAPEEQWLARHRAGARVVVRASTLATQLAAIRAGLGIGIYPCHAAEREPGVIRVAKAAALRETYWAVVHVDMVRSARVRAVLDFLSDQVARRLGEEQVHRRPGSRARRSAPRRTTSASKRHTQ